MSREAHPLANLFPTMTDTAYAELRESIRINGQREAITLHRDGRVIDGRNRDRVGDELGIQVRTKLFEGTDADILPFVMDINVVRRHLDESQRAVVAAKLAKMREGRPAKTAQICAVSQDQAATMLNVSRRSVQHASEVLTHAAPEIIAAVEQGVMAVSVAAGVARKPPARQLARLARDLRKADGTCRQPEGFYRTPPQCTHGLLAAERFPKKIAEVACGDGAISRVLIAAGHEVISSDLIDRGFGTGGVDFLTTTKRSADAAVTNPPYERADEFAQHLIKLGVRKFALLCRLAWLEGQDRLRTLWRHGKLARFWVFSPRQTLWRGDDDAAEDDGGQTAYAWFVFDLGHSEGTTLGWLEQDDTGQWHAYVNGRRQKAHA
jgi:hypothetical protein